MSPPSPEHPDRGNTTPHPDLRSDLPLATGGRYCVSQKPPTAAGGGAEVIADGLDSPEGLALLDNKTLLVAEVGKQRLTAIDLETGTRRTVAESLPIGQGAPPDWPKAFTPTGLAIGQGGVIYISSDLDCAIYRITPAGRR